MLNFTEEPPTQMVHSKMGLDQVLYRDSNRDKSNAMCRTAEPGDALVIKVRKIFEQPVHVEPVRSFRLPILQYIKSAPYCNNWQCLVPAILTTPYLKPRMAHGGKDSRSYHIFISSRRECYTVSGLEWNHHLRTSQIGLVCSTLIIW